MFDCILPLPLSLYFQCHINEECCHEILIFSTPRAKLNEWKIVSDIFQKRHFYIHNPYVRCDFDVDQKKAS